MADDFQELREKYKFHEETDSYIRIRAEAGIKSYCDLAIEDAREASLSVVQTFAGQVEFEGIEREFIVPSPYSTDGIPITAYKSKGCASVSLPAVFVYFHGGGNCVGSRKTHEVICKLLSKEVPSVVVNVDYRLAPEHKFPANHDDAKCVVRWIMMNKALIGAPNDSKVGVGGDSGGARIAATVTFEVPAISFQVLVYPNTDMRRQHASHEEFKNGPILTRALTDWFLDQYIDPADYENPRASPLLQPEVECAKLPPTLFVVAEIDALRDGTYAFNEKLKKAGVKTQIVTVKGAPHGFFHLPGHFKECCKKAHEKVIKFIKSQS